MKRILLVLSVLSVVLISQANTIKVSSLEDSGPGTLRDALFRADTSLFSPFQVDSIVISVSGTIVLDTTLEVPNVIIVGLGVNETKLDGANFDGPIMKFTDPFGEGQGPCDGCQEFPNRPLSAFGALVRDLTFENSYSSTEGGAGIIDENVTANFVNVYFVNNSAEYIGGAIALRNQASATIDSCYFNKNRASQGVGGAIGLQGDNYDFYVTNTVFEENFADSLGGAIYAYYYSPFYLDKTTFLNNTANEGGALAIAADYSYGNYISNCLFEGNKALSSNGGAIVLKPNSEYSSIDLDVSSTSFISNSSVKNGGAVYCESEGGYKTFLNCTMSGNSASNEGGAVYVNMGEVNLRFCTISENTANQFGAVVMNGDVGTISFYASVITKNLPIGEPVNVQGGEVSLQSNGYNFIDQSSVFPSWTNNNPLDTVGVSVPIDAMLSSLADNGGYAPTYEPMLGSPLINKIPGSSVFETTDQRGSIYKRVNDTDADIGSIEYQCDHIVDLTTDGTECGTLREAIEYANSNDGTDVIAFNLPQGSIIELMDSISITDQVYMYGHVYDFDIGAIIDSSRIGIRGAGAGINGLVFSGTSYNSEVVNFNFQNFDGAAIKLKQIDFVSISRNSFGTLLSDSTVIGEPNGIGVLAEGTGDSYIGVSSISNSPIAALGNQFFGNGVGVLADEDAYGIQVDNSLFSCNGVGISSDYSIPKIDTIFPGFISGKAIPDDKIQIFADTSCSKDQGLMFVGEVIAQSNGDWSSTAFAFNEGYVYVATAQEVGNEGLGSNTSPFSEPVTVTPCDSITIDSLIEACSDTVIYILDEPIPVGYSVNLWVRDEFSLSSEVRGDTVVFTDFYRSNMPLEFDLDNGMSCEFHQDFDLLVYEEPSQANITTFTYPMCNDSLAVDASVPAVGQGYWSTQSDLMFDDTSSVSTIVRNINEGDSLSIYWNVANGVCPVSVDSILLQRGIDVNPEVDLSASTPICSSDTIHFEANTNIDYDLNSDYFFWTVNGEFVSGHTDSLYSRSGFNDGDSVEVVLALGQNSRCFTKWADTSYVILSIPQQILSVMEDVESVNIGDAITVSILENDLIENQSVSSLSWVGITPSNATIIGDTAISYNGISKGIDTLEYHVFSSCGGVDTALLIVDVINTAPVGKDTVINVLSGGSVFINVNTLFADVENNFDEFSARIVNQSTSQGVFDVMSEMIEANYSNDISYTGIDTIWVEASDLALDKDTVRIIFQVSDTVTARAGEDQTITVPTAVLNGNAVGGYTIYWTSNSPSVTFDDVSLANTTISGLTPDDSPYELIWNISNGVKVESDTVLITVINTAPIAEDLMLTIKPGKDTVVAVRSLFVDAEDNVDSRALVNVVSQSNANAVVSLDNDSLSINYTSTPLYIGVDTVLISLTDVFGEVGVASVIVNVTEKLIPDAGTDFRIDTTVATLGATPVSGTYTGMWTSLKSGITFDDPTSATTEARGFNPKKVSYSLLWTISNGTNTASDTVVVFVDNVAPVITSVDILVTSELEVISAENLIRDRNNNLAKTVRVIKEFSFLSDSVVDIDVEALTITIDLRKDSKYHSKQPINDSLQYEICDEFGACDQSYIRVIREGELEKVLEKISNVDVETAYNFLSPNGDKKNETFFFDLVFKFADGTIDGEEWVLVDENKDTGELNANIGFERIFETLIESVDVSIINRWGDVVFEQEDYLGGNIDPNKESGFVVNDGEEFPEGSVWRGKDKNGDFVTPGTYYYYIIIKARKGADAKINGFIEVRN